MTEKTDGYVSWVEPKKLGFLPDDIEKDTLSVMLRLIIAKVKDEHARFQYNKELKHYASEITEIVKFARLNGYKSFPIEKSKYASSYSSVQSKEGNTLDIKSDVPGIVEDIDFGEINHSESSKKYDEIVDG